MANNLEGGPRVVASTRTRVLDRWGLTHSRSRLSTDDIAAVAVAAEAKLQALGLRSSQRPGARAQKRVRGAEVALIRAARFWSLEAVEPATSRTLGLTLTLPPALTSAELHAALGRHYGFTWPSEWDDAKRLAESAWIAGARNALAKRRRR